MDALKSSPVPFPLARASSPTTSSVSVGGRFIALLAAATLAVLVAKFVVPDVTARLVALEVRTPAAMVARMSICETCREDRDRTGKRPRQLRRLPVEVTQSTTFKKKSKPISVCTHCDGDVYEAAMRTHENRLKN